MRYLSQSSFWSVTVDIAGASSSSVSGFMNMGNQIGAAITAYLTPWIAARFGWTTSFLVAAGLCVVGAAGAGWWWNPATIPVSPADAGAAQIQALNVRRTCTPSPAARAEF